MRGNSRNRSINSVGSNVRRNYSNGKKKRKKHPRLKKFFIILLLLFVLVILVAVGIFCGIFFSDKFALSKEDLLLSNANTVIYDKDGEVIAELSGNENREIITKEDMTSQLPKAFVAIEDERFYDHNGVDWKRSMAATATYVTKGSSSFGGSTITQQLIKNITDEKESSGKAGAERKIKEMSRAYQVEKMISKDQILELYLNIIPLGADGGDICGVEMASTYYFSKSASELSIEECAFLAGINHSPNSYNPFKYASDEQKSQEVNQKIKSRTKTVLAKMKELNYISDGEYKQACENVDSGLQFNKGTLPNGHVESYFVQAAINQVVADLVEQKGFSEEYAKSRVYGGGYKIYTTESTAIQGNLEEIYKSDKYILNSSEAKDHSQSAMVIMDYTTGQVVGCMGGLGEDVNATGINRATSSKRQPGSSFKPIVTYGCGVEKGIINAATIYDNSSTTFGKDWNPSSTSTYSGLCTIRNAIEVSSNTVAAKIMSEIEPDNAIDFARQCGITTLVKSSENAKRNDSNLPSMALGGLTDGVTPLQMAAAYSMIANNGVYISPTFYTKVEDSSGAVILEPNQKTERVMTEQNSYIMKSLLKQPVEGSHGTATNCKIAGMDVGAKTGTTNSNKDRWLCGMTPYYVAATWYGYDDNAVVNGSGNYAAKVWIDVMKKVHANLEGKTFTEPSGIVTVNVCRRSGCKATSTCTDTYNEIFAEGNEPMECEGHSLKTCTESHLLATEYCPHTQYVGYVPEKEREPSWKTGSGGKYSVPSEYCNIHTTPQSSTTHSSEDPSPDIEISNDIIVQNVIGKTEAEAKRILKNLSVSVKYRSEPTREDGIVLKQSISSGMVVAKGAEIIITVNKIEKEPEKPVEKPTPPEEPTDNTVNPNQDEEPTE